MYLLLLECSPRKSKPNHRSIQRNLGISSSDIIFKNAAPCIEKYVCGLMGINKEGSTFASVFGNPSLSDKNMTQVYAKFETN